MFHKTLTVLFIWIGGNVGYAQHSVKFLGSQITCGATFKEAPTGTHQTGSKRSNKANIAIPDDSLLTLPVIVHIVHQGEEIGKGSNLSLPKILSQFKVLNKDFRKQDYTELNPSVSVSGDSYIEFIPAEFDPSGEPLVELGVHRIDATELGLKAPPYDEAYINTNIKPQNHWDPNRYLNVWVLDLPSSIKGFAQFPSESGLSLLEDDQGPPETDGVIVDTEQWGERSLSSGRILTHELGHFLGLIHIWGRVLGDCASDDGCEDTPASAGPISGCPVEEVSCGNVLMVENFMDNSGGQCQDKFTPCQIQRMRQALVRSPRRFALLNSLVGRSPQEVPKASFSSTEIGGACSGSLQFVDQSLNKPYFYSWDFGNGLSSEETNPTVTFEEEGVYSVSLTVSNLRGSNSIQIEVPVCITNTNAHPLDDLISLESPQVDEVAQNISVSAQIAQPLTLQLHLFDIHGKKVAQLFQGDSQPGIKEIEFSYQKFTPGVYVLIWEVAGVSLPQKIMIR